MAKAASAVGADGVLIEVHPDPDRALSDGPQSLDLAMFSRLMDELRKYVVLERRTVRNSTDNYNQVETLEPVV